jgi:hypothetical protein
MAAGSTYTPIATTTLGSAANTYTFSSIAGTYTDLVLVASGTVSLNGRDPSIRFNGDTASNYSYTNLSGNGTSASSSRVSNNTYIQMTTGAPWHTTTISNTILQVQNYSNATTYKTTINRSNDTTYGVDATVGLWRSTAAITSITVFLPTAHNFSIGTTFTLYGIAAA